MNTIHVHGGLALAETRPAHWMIVLHLGLEGCSVLQRGLRVIWPLGRAGELHQWPLPLSSRDTSSQAFPAFVCTACAYKLCVCERTGMEGLEPSLTPTICKAYGGDH